MIFLTVGSQLPFDRLVQAVDDWAQKHPGEEIIAQTGDSGYTPLNFKAQRVMLAQEYRRIFAAAQVVVSHAGTGVTMTAAEFAVPIIMLPRLPERGEIRNNHQVHYLENFRQYEGIYPATDSAEVQALLERRDSLQKMKPFSGASPELICAIKEFINS